MNIYEKEIKYKTYIRDWFILFFKAGRAFKAILDSEIYTESADGDSVAVCANNKFTPILTSTAPLNNSSVI